MKRWLAAVVTILVIGGFAAPFAQDGYHRYTVWRHLDGVIDARDRDAFRDWHGSARSFAAGLRERCIQANGPGSPACQTLSELTD